MKLLKLAVALASGALLAVPAPAHAHHAWMFNGTWVHQHTRTFPVFQQLTTSTDAFADASRNVWDAATILTLTETTCHDCSRIHELEGDFGDTGWLGLASIEAGWDGSHYTHGHASYNRHYLEYEGTMLMTTCHEEGHLIGLDHELVSGSASCMAGFYNAAGASVAPGPHDIDTINAMYPAWGH